MTTNDLPTPERVGELIEFYESVNRSMDIVPAQVYSMETLACLRELQRTMMTEERALFYLVGAVDGAGNLNSFGPCNDIMYKRGESDSELSGFFTPDQLRAIAYWMERSIPSPP